MFDELVASRFAAAGLIGVMTLAAGTVIRLLLLRGRTDEVANGRRQSLKTWWTVTLVVLATAAGGREVAQWVFAMLSLWAFAEFWRLVDGHSKPADADATSVETLPSDAVLRQMLLSLGFVLVVAHYLMIGLDRTDLSARFLPIAGLFAPATLVLLKGRGGGFVRRVGGFYLGLMTTTYLLSHTVWLFDIPSVSTSSFDTGLWVLFLVAVTEIDDIMQSIVGRRFGKHRLSPAISPNKTWEGFAGGVIASILLSIMIGPYLTLMSRPQCLLAGLLISFVGLLGDLNISAVKRDAGVKDSGRCLPGHGGLLDRLDSLTFTAPAFQLWITSFGLNP